MTSNAYLAEYVERVQELLSVFSLTDEDASEHIRLSNFITEYDPKLFIFEILFLNGEEKMFDPHVSELTVEYPDYPEGKERLLEDLKRLYQNKADLKFDWKEINQAALQEGRSDDLLARDLLTLPEDLERLDKFYEDVRDNTSSLDSKEKYDRIVEIFKKLVKRYEIEYVPSNLGVNALIYEAWHRGTFLYFSHDTGAGKIAQKIEFEQLLDALFIAKDEDAYRKVKDDIAINLGLRDILNEEKLLHDGQRWLPKTDKKWFQCIEYSLVHRTLQSNQKSFNRYLVHYPLIIDDYRFVGFAYLYADWEGEQYDTPEVFRKTKYPKIYHYIQSVSESLSASLRRDALARPMNFDTAVWYEQKEEDIFYQVAKQYFTCFSVFQEDDKIPTEIKVGQQLIYNDHKTKIYGPKWIENTHKELLRQEIDGKEILGGEKIPGLWKSVQERKKQRLDLQQSGWQKRSSQMSHQAAGLVAEVWFDPQKAKLQPQAKGCLWHLKTLIDVWGSRPLGAKVSISSGPEADFPDWETFQELEVLQNLADIGLAHALRRATSARTERLEDQAVVTRALEIVDSDNSTEQFRKLLNFSIKEEVNNVEDMEWLTLRGFALCFHHCLWQAAYHAFRALYIGNSHNQDHYLKVQILDQHVTIRNSISSINSDNHKADEGQAFNQLPPRDKDFFDTLNNRVKEVCVIKGPTLTDGFWQTTICRTLPNE